MQLSTIEPKDSAASSRRVFGEGFKLFPETALFRLSSISFTQLVFFASFALWLVACVLFQTSLEPIWSEEIKNAKLLAVSICFVQEIFYLARNNRFDILQVLALCLVAVGSLQVANTALFQSLFFAYCSRHYSINSVLSCFGLTIAASVLYVYLSSALGYMDSFDLAESTSRTARLSMGFVWPSRFPTFYFAVVMAYVCIKKNHASPPVLLVLLITDFLIYLNTDSRNPFIFTAALIIAALIRKHISRNEIKTRRAWFALLIPVCVLISIVLPLMYDPASDFWIWLDRLLARRLTYSSIGLENAYISLFGMEEFANQVDVNPLEAGYFDSGYLVLLYGFGILGCVAVLGGFACVLVQSYEKRDFYICFSTCLTLLFSMIYPHMFIYLCYSPIMFMIPKALEETALPKLLTARLDKVNEMLRRK